MTLHMTHSKDGGKLLLKNYHCSEAVVISTAEDVSAFLRFGSLSGCVPSLATG